MPKLFRFAELADGTELVIRLYCSDEKHAGAVYAGRHGGEAERIVARSFTDFLLRTHDSADEPYFRHR